MWTNYAGLYILVLYFIVYLKHFWPHKTLTSFILFSSIHWAPFGTEKFPDANLLSLIVFFQALVAPPLAGGSLPLRGVLLVSLKTALFTLVLVAGRGGDWSLLSVNWMIDGFLLHQPIPIWGIICADVETAQAAP